MRISFFKINLDFSVGYSFISLLLVFFLTGYISALDNKSSFFYDFISSTFSAFIFYLITVTMRESHEIKKSEELTHPMISTLITNYLVAMKNGNLIEKFELASIDNDSLSDKINSLEFYESKNIRSSRDLENNHEHVCYFTTYAIKETIENIKPYLNFMQVELIQKLHDIEVSSHILTITQHYNFFKSYPNKIDKNHLYDLHNKFIELGELIKYKSPLLQK